MANASCNSSWRMRFCATFLQHGPAVSSNALCGVCSLTLYRILFKFVFTVWYCNTSSLVQLQILEIDEVFHSLWTYNPLTEALPVASLSAIYYWGPFVIWLRMCADPGSRKWEQKSLVKLRQTGYTKLVFSCNLIILMNRMMKIHSLVNADIADNWHIL